MPFYAKSLDANYARLVDKELRASHAGETGAVWIYRGALVAEFIWCLLHINKTEDDTKRFIREHLETERAHLAIFESEMPLFRGSFILPLWIAAGFITGFLPRLLGKNWFFYTIYCVEEFVDLHYDEQCKNMSALSIPPSNVIERFKHCQEGEQHHRDEALAMMTRQPSLLMRLWGRVVEKGSLFAVAIAKLI
ncbi:demethoxyubiquinone hydroxylase family protein [Alteromonas portus]|uniref:Demethoxyubiquinone hydroxylase family protein n=1 Tax=Alteromonas portus TaxID=2565549 RepID=A0A4U0ZIA7_9ALTE|nr:demethoxyubiquinone hydroxylase family protein [Alteromonas portus]TKB04308.1 demethoxyubiquinone hydroxylase family protein [Alteromonas portus]